MVETPEALPLPELLSLLVTLLAKAIGHTGRKLHVQLTRTGIKNTAGRMASITTTTANTPSASMNETNTDTEKDMVDEETLRLCVGIIKKHFLAYRLPPLTLPAEYVIYNAAREIATLLYDRKPLDCEGIELGGKGKSDHR
jgi:hypothetical protein